MKLFRSFRIHFLASAILIPGLIAIATATPAAAGSSAMAGHRAGSPDQPGNFAYENLPTVGTDAVRCLGIRQDNKYAGIWDCTYANDQNWHLGQELYGDTGFYQLINADNECLGTDGGGTGKGTQVVGNIISFKNDQANQKPQTV